MTPLHYGLCNQTVTLYGVRGGEILRRVAEGCYLAAESGITENTFGKSRLKKFLLIIPGDQDLQPGDRVFRGIGPEKVRPKAKKRRTYLMPVCPSFGRATKASVWRLCRSC